MLIEAFRGHDRRSFRGSNYDRGHIGSCAGQVSLRRLLLVWLITAPAWLAPVAKPDKGTPVDGHPFLEHVTVDRLGRSVTFYISEPEPTGAAVPLAVYVQGTGCSSHFTRSAGRIVSGVGSLIREAFRGRARVAMVEKPGVEPFDDQGDRPMQQACRPEFFREHTLDRWSEAVAAAIRASHELAGIDDSSTLVLGISEGGMVAVRVSNVLVRVTHAASLSGGGPNHMYVLAEYVRRHGLDAEELVYHCWQQVQSDPDSTERFCLDHPFRHWSGFYTTSLTEECLESSAQLYLAHGSADEQNPVAGFDMMRAELVAKGRSAVFARLDGAGHSLNLPSQPAPEGLVSVLDELAKWFVEN